MIVVTGANGFVGRYLVSRLSEELTTVLATGRGARGRAYYENLAYYYDRTNIPFKLLDITKEEDFLSLPKKNVDAVIHLAGLLSIDAEHLTVEDYMRNNVVGTYNVLEYCRQNDVKTLIYSMTHSDVNRAKDIRVTEKTPQQYGGVGGDRSPLPYIISKISAMNLIDTYSKEIGLRGVSLRLPGIRGFGSRDTHYNCVFHQFIQKAIKSKPIEIWGEHTTVRDFVYIKDVTTAIWQVLKNDNAHGLYNIGSGVGLTIEDEAKAIIKVFSPPDNQSPLIYRPDIEEVRKRSYIFDISKAKKDFDYDPQYSYEDGLRDFKKEMEIDRFRELRELYND